VAQDFRDIRLGYENERLEATLTNYRISSMPRAVGRAARTMLSFAPLETREIRITYREGPLPIATYTFVDAKRLQRYFNGMMTRQDLRPYVSIEYARPNGGRDEDVDTGETLQAFQEPLPQSLVLEREGADLIALKGENVAGGRLAVKPALSTFFNDPSGAFHYDLSLYATYDRALARRTFLSSALRIPIVEDVSSVTQPSNSTLPHVRTDIALYRQKKSIKLDRLVVNRFGQSAERVYWRASAGVYEEMFSGFGGQALYLGRDGAWGVDLDVNQLWQRDFSGWFGLQDYNVLTALASLNYRMAQGVTGTVRAGRFLAKDEGARFELKRRFASGWQAGIWYTFTNGHDITSPGTPSSPYHDKGIFLALPLETLLARDTRATAGISLAPWTRDVGQMVVSPGDLYSILENPVTRMRESDGLSQLGDRGDDYALPKLGADRVWPDFVAADLFSAKAQAGEIDWGRSLLIGGAITLGSVVLDKPAERFAREHKDASAMKGLINFGDALPVAALGVSAIFAFDESRQNLSDAGVAALEAGAAGYLVSTGLRYGVGRARPSSGQGASDFDPFSREDQWHSFPSRHTTVMWAAVTPYAEEYDMPWLYGVAAITNAARVGSREHWVSDTVAGSLIGYALGHIAWQARRDARRGKTGPSLAVGPGNVVVAWPFE
jgi:membrane-associated phospholipid phosphatase